MIGQPRQADVRVDASSQPAEPAPGTTGPETDGAPRDTPATPAAPVEIGGRDGPEPTRYGDWEKNGRCIDF